MRWTDLEFFRQVVGALPVGKPAENEHELGTRSMRAAKNGASEQVEDFFTLPTTELDQRSPSSIMGSLIRGKSVPQRAKKTVRVKDVEQDAVALVLVEEIEDGEKRRHGGKSREAREKEKALVKDAVRCRTAPAHFT